MIHINVRKFLARAVLVGLFFFGIFQAVVVAMYLSVTTSEPLWVLGLLGSLAYMMLIIAWAWGETD